VKKDELGDRMKRDYEDRTRFYLPRRTYTLIRCDGKAFHSYTRGCARPYDLDLMADMDTTAVRLCEEMGGARFAFVQSDEISVLLTDFGAPLTEAWLDGNVQKMASVGASLATAAFNQARLSRMPGRLPKTAAMALFDARVWTIPDRTEVFNYFVWRQQDASRNSLSMTARAHFPQKRLHAISCDALQQLLLSEKGIDWNDLPIGFQRGRAVVPVIEEKTVEYVDKRTQERKVAAGVLRRTWRVMEPPVFTRDREWLFAHIPVQE